MILPGVSPPGLIASLHRQKVLQTLKISQKMRLWDLSEPTQHYPQEVSVMNEAMPNTVDATERMKQLILEIVQALVDQPGDVSVEMIDDHDSTVIRLRVAHQDIGKVIGKQGRTARSLRTILGAASMKLHHRFALDILEDGNGRPGTE